MLVPAAGAVTALTYAATHPSTSRFLKEFLKQKAYEYLRDNDIPTIAGHVGSVAGTGRRAIEYFSGNRTAYGPNVTVAPAVDTLRIVSPPSYSAVRPGLSAAYYAPSYRRPPRYRRRRFRRGRGLRRYYRLRRRGMTAGAYFVRKNFW